MRIEERGAAIEATVQPRRVLIMERAGKSELGGGAPRYIVLQRRKVLLPLGLAFPHFCQRVNPQPRAIIREFHNLDRARIAFRLVVIGERGKANTLHAYQQSIRPMVAAP